MSVAEDSRCRAPDPQCTKINTKTFVVGKIRCTSDWMLELRFLAGKEVLVRCALLLTRSDSCCLAGARWNTGNWIAATGVVAVVPSFGVHCAAKDNTSRVWSR